MAGIEVDPAVTLPFDPRHPNVNNTTSVAESLDLEVAVGKIEKDTQDSVDEEEKIFSITNFQLLVRSIN